VIAAVETAEATNCRREIFLALAIDFLLKVATTISMVTHGDRDAWCCAFARVQSSRGTFQSYGLDQNIVKSITHKA
jgi:hypothetical protein